MTDEQAGYAPTPKTKKRVVCHSTGQCGVVLEEGDDRSLIHWGTTSARDGDKTVPLIRTSWVDNDDLTLLDEPVFYGDVDEHGNEVRNKVYDPEEHRAGQTRSEAAGAPPEANGAGSSPEGAGDTEAPETGA